MNRTAKQLLMGYGVFCAANAAIGYFWARNQPPGTPLADLNTKLLRFNVLAYLLPQASGPSVPAMPIGQPTFPAPGTAQVTDFPTGTTTYFPN